MNSEPPAVYTAGIQAVPSLGPLWTSGIAGDDRMAAGWLSAVGTKPGVQQKMMRHADIRTTFNIYGDVVTDEMITASSKVARLAFLTDGAQNGAQEL